jgi:multicomponent K+:H+ antiporter subunit D
VAAGGLPPLAGFLGKSMLLQAAGATPLATWTWAIVLLASLGTIVATARAGSQLFWRDAPDESASEAHGAAATAPLLVPKRTTTQPGSALHALAIGLLVLLFPLMAVFAGPIHGYTNAAAAQLFERRAYIDAVLGARPVPAAIDVRREMRERGEIKGAKKP